MYIARHMERLLTQIIGCGSRGGILSRNAKIQKNLRRRWNAGRFSFGVRDMLYYTEFGLSRLEVPKEASICIYISGCRNRCVNCHYPELQRPNYGDLLFRNYRKIVELYLKAASCVCFFGEGKNTFLERKVLTLYSFYAHRRGLKTCLYSGRDTDIEKWMEAFDYIKLGSYQPDLGPLSNPQTNQRMYRKSNPVYVDITKEFWLDLESEDIAHKSEQ